MIMHYDELGLLIETNRWVLMLLAYPDNDLWDSALTNSVFDIKLWRSRLVLEDKQRIAQAVDGITTA